MSQRHHGHADQEQVFRRRLALAEIRQQAEEQPPHHDQGTDDACFGQQLEDQVIRCRCSVLVRDIAAAGQFSVCDKIIFKTQ